MYKNGLIILGISLGAMVLVGLAARTTPFRDLDHWTYDFLVTHKPDAGPSRKIVIVDFDDASIARFRRFPVPRDVVADVIDRISKAAPKVIGLDFLLTEARTEPQDDSMEKALARAGNVVLASQSGSGGIPAIVPLPRFCAPDPAGFGDCQKGAFGFAPVNLPIDSDGFVRRMILFSFDQHKSESFPLKIAELFTGSPLTAGRKSASFAGHDVFYADDSARVLIGSWSTTPAENLSALDVLDGKLEAAKIKDKIVLIGQSNDAARDREFTPLFRKLTASGVRLRLAGTQIHAASIATLLDGSAIHPIPNWLVLTVSLVLTCLTVRIFLRFPPRLSIPVAVVLAVACYAAAQLAFNLSHQWFPYLFWQLSIAVSVPLALTYQFLTERFQRTQAMAERAQIMSLFSRYVAPEVAAEIWKRRDEVILAGEERVATVLFSDIRSFTATSAGKPSREVLTWLNQYFTAMDEVIAAEGGFLNKFIGDGLMVLFGVPLSRSVEDDATHAVTAALRMLEKVKELNLTQSPQSAFASLRIGIGIHTGPLICGNIGSHNRLEYSAIGDSVNLASRLESLNKEFHTRIVLSEATYQLVSHRFSGFRELGLVPVRGFEDKIRLYTIGPADEHQPSVAPNEGVVNEVTPVGFADPSRHGHTSPEQIDPSFPVG